MGSSSVDSHSTSQYTSVTVNNSRQFLKITWWVFKLYWSISPVLSSIVLFTQIIAQFQGLVYAYVFGIALDRVIQIIQLNTVNPADIVTVVMYFVVLDFVFRIFATANSRASNMLGNRDVWVMRKYLYLHLHTLGLSKLEDAELTNKTTRFNEMYNFISQHLTLIMGLVASILTLIASGLIVGNAVPILLPFFAVVFILKFLVNQKFIARMWQFNRNNTEYRRKAFSVSGALTDPQSLKELLITRGVNYLKTYFDRYVTAFLKETDSIYAGWLRFEVIQSISDAILYAVGLYLIITKGVGGAITIGTITFLIRSIGTFANQLEGLSYRLARARESAIRLKDAQEIFEIYKPDTDGSVVLADDATPPQIEFNDVTFTYPNTKRPIFENLNLTIMPGEKIAIVGENGAGKTTLVKLLSRLYRIESGEILISGNEISTLSIQSFYDKLGILFQDFNQYGHLSVLENVGIGKTKSGKFNKKKIIQALKDAEAYEFVQKYPNKLDQILSEKYKGGIRPSTGQWQKIAIARFFYRNAPILILDEPTASIDAIAEAQIFDNIYKFMKGKTVIIISHRFSTVRNADRILVLDKGRIIEEGTHEHLLKLKGKYAKAFNLQAKGYS